ncbi:uncharacterized protein LOC121371753 [Gigantopelta aegis]|uniref:uncharacterized protein LOC121371753 n=1 Tax=Gigantopelta aegis TaxID=1735272 RepID=UPI001B88E756|nr:uncharacterized protein LOC121371753 [Gigantopelta aegis]
MDKASNSRADDTEDGDSTNKKPASLVEEHNAGQRQDPYKKPVSPLPMCIHTDESNGRLNRNTKPASGERLSINNEEDDVTQSIEKKPVNTGYSEITSVRVPDSRQTIKKGLRATSGDEVCTDLPKEEYDVRQIAKRKPASARDAGQTNDRVPASVYRSRDQLVVEIHKEDLYTLGLFSQQLPCTFLRQRDYRDNVTSLVSMTSADDRCERVTMDLCVVENESETKITSICYSNAFQTVENQCEQVTLDVRVEENTRGMTSLHDFKSRLVDSEFQTGEEQCKCVTRDFSILVNGSETKMTRLCDSDKSQAIDDSVGGKSELKSMTSPSGCNTRRNNNEDDRFAYAKSCCSDREIVMTNSQSRAAMLSSSQPTSTQTRPWSPPDASKVAMLSDSLPPSTQTRPLSSPNTSDTAMVPSSNRPLLEAECAYSSPKRCLSCPPLTAKRYLPHSVITADHHENSPKRRRMSSDTKSRILPKLSECLLPDFYKTAHDSFKCNLVPGDQQMSLTDCETPTCKNSQLYAACDNAVVNNVYNHYGYFAPSSMLTGLRVPPLMLVHRGPNLVQLVTTETKTEIDSDEENSNNDGGKMRSNCSNTLPSSVSPSPERNQVLNCGNTVPVKADCSSTDVRRSSGCSYLAGTGHNKTSGTCATSDNIGSSFSLSQDETHDQNTNISSYELLEQTKYAYQMENSTPERPQESAFGSLRKDTSASSCGQTPINKDKLTLANIKREPIEEIFADEGNLILEASEQTVINVDEKRLQEICGTPTDNMSVKDRYKLNKFLSTTHFKTEKQIEHETDIASIDSSSAGKSTTNTRNIHTGEKTLNENRMRKRPDRSTFDLSRSIVDQYLETDHQTSNSLDVATSSDCKSTATCSSDLTHKDRTVEDKTSSLKAFLCFVCQRQFGKRKYLQRHLKRVHAVHNDKTVTRCSVCGKCFTTKSCFEDHVSSDHSSTNDNSLTPVVCPYCGEILPGSVRYRSHLEEHLSKTHFVCPFPGCQKSLYRKCNLTQHVKKVHLTKDKSADRKLCPSVQDEASLKHRPFPCTWPNCGKLFSARRNLSIHMRIHNDEKPFSCRYCEYRCRQTAALNWHLMKHGINKYEKHGPKKGTKGTSSETR